MYKGQCVHFNGVQNEACKAGVNYKKLVGGESPFGSPKLPCVKVHQRAINRILGTEGEIVDTSKMVHCDKYEEPTDQQIAEYSKRLEEHIEEVSKLFPIISKIKDENPSQTNAGVDVCPKCGGQLVWSIAGSNGHVWIKCKECKLGCFE